MDNEDTYLNAIRSIMRPLARSMVNRGMTLPIFLNITKNAMVQAVEDVTPITMKLTDSRISLMTGVHRKDVRKFRNSGRIETGGISVNARVIALWTGDRTFLDPSGEPALLPRTGTASFDELVAMVSTDIRPRTLLDEWIRRDIVSIVEIETKPHIKLHLDNYAPATDQNESMYFFGENIADHIDAASQNIENPKSREFERAVYATNLSRESVERLEAFAEKKAMKMLVELNKLAFELAEMDRDASGNSYRFRMGAYFHKENTVDNTKRGAMDIEPGEE